MLSLLAAMAEGGGWVSAGVMVGVVATTMTEGEGGGCGSWQKKREKNYHNTVWYDLSYYPMLSQNKSKCVTATVLCTLQNTIACTLVHLICFL